VTPLSTVRSRLGSSPLGLARRLRHRVDDLEAAVAENQALRPHLEQLVAEIESSLDAFAGDADADPPQSG
jgi:hypothetical protein